jgi:integrase
MLTEIPPEVEAVLTKLTGAYADSTVKGYRYNIQFFAKWCAKHDIEPLKAKPADYVRYVVFMQTRYASSTIEDRIKTMTIMLKFLGLPLHSEAPSVRLALKRMRRAIGRPPTQATPLTREILDQLKSVCDTTPKGIHDSLILQLGYETLRRSSELCAFNFNDIQRLANGKVVIVVRRSKDDQEGYGKLVPISRTLRTLIDLWRYHVHSQGIPSTGPLLRHINKHGQISKRRLSPSLLNSTLAALQLRAGLTHIGKLTGHSFRVGAALDMLVRGVPVQKIMLRGGWKSRSVTLDYLRSWVGMELDIYE